MSLWLRTFLGLLALPFNVLIVIPVILIWLSAESVWGAYPRETLSWPVWLGGLLCISGLVMMAWTVSDFIRHGEGTPAPWDPPKKLVIQGLYRFVRNPMLSGVMTVLFSETLIAHSWALAVWLGIFVLANAVYIPLVEEPALERRFGDDYRLYKANVPRWIPRLTPWSLPGSLPPE